MDLKITQKIEEPLLSRTKVKSEIHFDKATPSNQEVKSVLAKELDKDEKLIDVKGVYTLYGLKKARVLCYIYDNEEILKKIIGKKKVTGKKVKGEKKKEEIKDSKEEKAVETKEKTGEKQDKPEAKKEEKPVADQKQKTEEKKTEIKK